MSTTNGNVPGRGVPVEIRAGDRLECRRPRMVQDTPVQAVDCPRSQALRALLAIEKPQPVAAVAEDCGLPVPVVLVVAAELRAHGLLQLQPREEQERSWGGQR